MSPLGEQNSNRSRELNCLRDRFEIENVAAEIDDHDRVVDFAAHGIKTIGTSMAVAVSLDNLVERPDLFTMLANPHGESDILQVTVTSRDATGSRLHEFDLPGDSIILLTHRREPASVPHHDSTLRVDDMASVTRWKRRRISSTSRTSVP